MNYKEIGKFIATKRKEKGMTQNDIANKLNITDRAVSRWERGVGCPDISILEPLSNVLGVSILEILHGKKVENNENEILVDILKENKKRINKWKMFTYIILNILLFIFLFLFIFSFFIPKIINIREDLEMQTIISPSMNPTYNIKDVVVIEKTSISELKVGDVISFYSNISLLEDIPVIHRISKINYDGTGDVSIQTYSSNNVTSVEDNKFESRYCIITKGDSNSEEDLGCVNESNLIGKVKYKVPFVMQLFNRTGDVSIYVGIFLILGVLSILYLDILYLINNIYSD